MRLMPDRNPRFSEDEMQEAVAQYFANKKFRSPDPYNWEGIVPKVYREIRIKEIGRISDVVIYLTDRKIINVECKLRDYNYVLNQAKNHLMWADYSYICLSAETYLPIFILNKMISLGIGLLLWHPDYFVKVLQSGYNKTKDKKIREIVLSELKKRNSIATAQDEQSKQGGIVLRNPRKVNLTKTK